MNRRVGCIDRCPAAPARGPRPRNWVSVRQSCFVEHRAAGSRQLVDELYANTIISSLAVSHGALGDDGRIMGLFSLAAVECCSTGALMGRSI
jgi:hypothetical protein